MPITNSGRGTKISWTDMSWNPVVGCSKVSEGCRFCYAERLALKNGWTPKPWTAANAAENVILKPHKLDEPRKLKAPSRIFVNSLSDVFHEQIPGEYLARIFDVMLDCPQHTFQVLTKRPERAAEWKMRTRGTLWHDPGPWETWPPHIWLGTSVEDQRSADERIPHLLRSSAAVRFLSMEPLLAPVDVVSYLKTGGLHWVIVGGESGPGFRPMDHAWAWSIYDACRETGVPFFFKQSAAHRTEMGTTLRDPDGVFWTIHQYPGQIIARALGPGHRCLASGAAEAASTRQRA